MKRPMILVLAIAAGLVFAAGCGTDNATRPPAPQDDAPPLPPSGMRVTFPREGLARLTWTPNAEPDLAGYRVYLYDPAPMRTDSYKLLNESGLVTESTYDVPVPFLGTVWVRLTAVDRADNESRSTPPHQISWQASPPGESSGGGGKEPPPFEGDPNNDPRGGGGVATPPGGGLPGGGHDGTTPDGDPNQH